MEALACQSCRRHRVPCSLSSASFAHSINHHYLSLIGCEPHTTTKAIQCDALASCKEGKHFITCTIIASIACATQSEEVAIGEEKRSILGDADVTKSAQGRCLVYVQMSPAR